MHIAAQAPVQLLSLPPGEVPQSTQPPAHDSSMLNSPRLPREYDFLTIFFPNVFPAASRPPFQPKLLLSLEKDPEHQITTSRYMPSANLLLLSHFMTQQAGVEGVQHHTVAAVSAFREPVSSPRDFMQIRKQILPGYLVCLVDKIKMCQTKRHVLLQPSKIQTLLCTQMLQICKQEIQRYKTSSGKTDIQKLKTGILFSSHVCRELGLGCSMQRNQRNFEKLEFLKDKNFLKARKFFRDLHLQPQ